MDLCGTEAEEEEENDSCQCPLLLQAHEPTNTKSLMATPS